MRSPRCSVAVLVAFAVVMSGCGGSDGGQPATATNPVASTPDATAPPADATQPGTTAVTPPPATTTETQPAEPARDAQQVRVPASFVVVGGGRLTPPTITVPPFLAVEISVRSDDGRAHRLVLETSTPHALAVAAGQRTAVRIAGLRAGRYPVTLDGRRAGALVAGGEVGP